MSSESLLQRIIQWITSNHGTIRFSDSEIGYNGCGETYRVCAEDPESVMSNESLLQRIIQWIKHLFAYHAATGQLPPAPPVVGGPPVVVHPVPVLPTQPLPAQPLPIPPSPQPVPPATGANDGSGDYGVLDLNGFCTVAQVEALRAEIAATDPTYAANELPTHWLCPGAVGRIATPKARIAAQWQCDQVNWRLAGAIAGTGQKFFPGYFVVIDVRPGAENEPDTTPSKWLTAQGPFIDPPHTARQQAQHMAVSSVPEYALGTGQAIADAQRAIWVKVTADRKNAGGGGFAAPPA